MSKPIVMSKEEWNTLLENIRRREKPSTYMLREKMKEVLGFTVRHHTVWLDNKDRLETTVHLDFYDEAKRTMFLLKYGNGKN